ncbi:hypothetical protein ACFW1A_19435 [Kitasatospora sp. NPDC058965]|uniref:hypothetical protein n=1 Tax=Kitasatospora sp. NPDC058965 TaxID=3346682 RepID=UPI0036BE9BF3
MTSQDFRTDAELAALDVPVLLRFGLPQDGPHRRALFGEGAVAGALQLGGLGVPPRSLAFLAQVVRAGGARYAAGLPEPLPGPAAEPARGWLEAAAAVVADPDGDELTARYLEAVAAVLDLRQESGR